MNEAFLQVKRNKGAYVVDGMKVGDLGEYLRANREVIKEQIKCRKYKLQPVRRIEIPKLDGGIRNLGRDVISLIRKYLVSGVIIND